jgi:hypothetical protein
MSDQDTAEEGVEPVTPTECGPCRGLGKVVSNLGGKPTEVVCPWCEGTKKFIPDHDSQQHWEHDTPPPNPASHEADTPESEQDASS